MVLSNLLAPPIDRSRDPRLRSVHRLHLVPRPQAQKSRMDVGRSMLLLYHRLLNLAPERTPKGE
jgi:hypothetical protein